MAHSPALRRALRVLVPQADVVHIHNLWQYPQFAAYRAAREAGVPYVVSPHGALDPYVRGHGTRRKWATTRLWQRELFDNAAMIHVTTRDEERNIADVAPHVPRSVVPCGIDFAEFASLPEAARFREGALGGYEGPVVLFLGRVTYKKGLDLLVRAFALARRDHPARLVVVGPDDEGMTPGLQRLAGELGIAADVVFPGPMYGDDRLAALAATDVWVLSSHAENFGIAVIEAMAAGCATAITDGVSLGEEVAAAGAGIVTPVDAGAFADGLGAVLGDDALRARLEESGRTFAAGYDWSVVGPELVGMYEAAAARRPGDIRSAT
jgi:glycosyltransferase involved in cell wall biosynthesis